MQSQEVNVDATSKDGTSDIILNDDLYFKLPSHASVQEKLNFVQSHPRQPMSLETMYENVSWSFNKLYNRVVEGQRGKLIPRK